MASYSVSNRVISLGEAPILELVLLEKQVRMYPRKIQNFLLAEQFGNFRRQDTVEFLKVNGLSYVAIRALLHCPARDVD